MFTLNTKKLSGKVTVYDRATLVNGKNRGYLVKSRAEARQVSEALSAAVGSQVRVR